MRKVLFLCTGNYYRSRYAEILFNWQAKQANQSFTAISRGLAPDPRNPGPMSQDTIRALQRMGISVDEHLRMPIRVTDTDFASNEVIVAVKEAEHHPMIQREFPTWLDKVEFWHVHDLDCSSPVETFTHLDLEVAGLLERLAGTKL